MKSYHPHLVESSILTGTIKDVIYDEYKHQYYVFVDIDNEDDDSEIDYYANLFFPDCDGRVKLTLGYGDYNITMGLFEYPNYICIPKVIGRYVEFHMVMEYIGDIVEQYMTNLDVYKSKEKYLDGNDMSE